jgi:predicted kinase
MPGQRGKHQVSKGLWLDEELRDLAVVALEKKGVEFSEVVKNLLLDLIEEQLTEEEQNEIRIKTQIKQEQRPKKANKSIRKKA